MSKQFLHAMAVSGYLPKLERGLQLACRARFLHDFYKNFPYLMLYQLTKFNYIFFFLLKMLNKMCY